MRTDIIGLTLNYRDAARTDACVRSLLEDGLGQVLVWDNSEDAGASASALRQRVAGDERIVIVESALNLGFAAGVNAAVQICRDLAAGAAILLINNDAVLVPGAVARFRQAWLAHASASIIAPRINHAGRELGLGFYQRATGLLSWKRRPASFRYASGCCVLITPAAASAPVFDEAFFMYGEDWELGARLARKGDASLVAIDAVLVWHEGSASTRIGSLFYETHMTAAHAILSRRLTPAPFTAARFSRFLFLTLRCVVRCARARSLTPLRGFVAGLAMARRAGRRPAIDEPPAQ
jgi:N-acetylglucosaminyl-diphospho-decaprenol L-rhamnosyltransferase